MRDRAVAPAMQKFGIAYIACRFLYSQVIAHISSSPLLLHTPDPSSRPFLVFSSFPLTHKPTSPSQPGRKLYTYRHPYTSQTHVRAQSLPHPCKLPENTENAVFVPVHESGQDGVDIGTRTDEEEDGEEEGLEVEDCCLDSVSS